MEKYSIGTQSPITKHIKLNEAAPIQQIPPKPHDLSQAQPSLLYAIKPDST